MIKRYMKFLFIGAATVFIIACEGTGDTSSVSDTIAPQFISSSSISIMENRTDIILLTVVATDASEVIYEITNLDTWGQYFDLNSSTGALTFADGHIPNYEVAIEYYITVKATDTSGNESTQDITLTISDEKILHNGISYESIVSPYTGRIWLDRNLGAARVCNTYDDVACYGDYYQWGRNTDGHEDSMSPTTNILASTITPEHVMFILVTANTFNSADWTTADDNLLERQRNWSSSYGDSICPVGYRVPNIHELNAEFTNSSIVVVNRNGAFSFFLKLPSAGARQGLNGELKDENENVYLYSTSISEDPLSPRTSFFFGFNSNEQIENKATLTSAFSIRCIKNSL